MRVMTFSRFYPKGHPKVGQATHFVEKLWTSLLLQGQYYFTLDNPMLEKEIEYFYSTPPEYKEHTIRNGHRWSEGDWFSPRVWSGTPYRSKQIIIAPPIQVKKVWDIERCMYGVFSINGKDYHTSDLDRLAANDGLLSDDLWHWMKWPMKGQIICWNDKIAY